MAALISRSLCCSLAISHSLFANALLVVLAGKMCLPQMNLPPSSLAVGVYPCNSLIMLARNLRVSSLVALWLCEYEMRVVRARLSISVCG